MNRRRLLQNTIAATLLTQLPAAQAKPGSALRWQQQFAAALPQHPWLSAYRSVSAEQLAAPAIVRGSLPAALRGSLYRNGPARHEIGDFRYQHWFDGDGMLQAWRLEDSGIRHQARIIETPKYVAERQANKPLYPAFGTALPESAPLNSADSMNVANISVLPHHGKLLALWEAGSAVAMDPDTLATKGLHSFSSETQGVPFSAHPKVEADGSLWNFGYASSEGLLVFWHIDRSGTVKRTGVIPLQPMGMPHDFVVTQRHLVLMVAPLHFEPAAQGSQSFLDSHRWHPERPTQVLVVDKNDFSKWRTYELPAQWVFHYGNAWEDSAGVIRFDAARAPSPQAMTSTFRDLMRGVVSPAPASEHHLYRIDTRSGSVSEEPLFGTHSGIDSEFPCIDPRVCGRRYQQLSMMTATAQNPAPAGGLNAVSRYRFDSDRLDTYTYPINQLPEEHLFVPEPGSALESDGWILGTAFDFTSEQTLLNVFAADRLEQGPVCTATLPYGLPLGLHGKFVAARA